MAFNEMLSGGKLSEQADNSALFIPLIVLAVPVSIVLGLGLVQVLTYLTNLAQNR